MLAWAAFRSDLRDHTTIGFTRVTWITILGWNEKEVKTVIRKSKTSRMLAGFAALRRGREDLGEMLPGIEAVFDSAAADIILQVEYVVQRHKSSAVCEFVGAARVTAVASQFFGVTGVVAVLAAIFAVGGSNAVASGVSASFGFSHGLVRSTFS
jgi:hypothetical protein